VRQALPEAYVDLAFFPTAAQRDLFERQNIPFLLGTQSLRSADEFDLILISNAYSLELLNLPYLLLHSNIPLLASERSPEWPIILLGGSNAIATQSIIQKNGDSLVDGIFFGEGEGLVGKLAQTICQSTGHDPGKETLLNQVAIATPGFWVSGSRRRAIKATCKPSAQALPISYPILNTPEAHTAHLQINYGCPAFCSFCLEGYDRKPYRELALSDVLAAAFQLKQAQGVEEIGLYSFNFNTHSDILPMVLALHRLFERVSLKSQRLDILEHTPTLLEAEVAADKREFTLGIEGISANQRAFLHKSLDLETITTLLSRLMRQPIRRIKLFYVLTGHETQADVDEFRDFVRWLKETRHGCKKKPRIIFSAGLLIRQPNTPLRHDRLLLDEADWKPIVGPVKSACETNGFEFRLAFDWPAYCTNQVLALGGHWLLEPLIKLAQKGYCFDAVLPPDYWNELDAWLRQNGHWNTRFLDEKPADYVFPSPFVDSNVSGDFLYHQYQAAKSSTDDGYCLGSQDTPGHCLDCGACANGTQRQALTHHQIQQPPTGYLPELHRVMAHKRQLTPIYIRLRTAPRLANVEPAFLNSFIFREILASCPELADNLLSVHESLFTNKPLNHQFPGANGETVFALKAWDTTEVYQALLGQQTHKWHAFEIIGPVETFTPGSFNRLHLDIRLPTNIFFEPRPRLEEYLRGAYLPYSLRREGKERLVFDLPDKAIKKKILFGGFIEEHLEEFTASLDIGIKFDLQAFFSTFQRENLHYHARVTASELEL
jgi:hypothetical protein